MPLPDPELDDVAALIAPALRFRLTAADLAALPPVPGQGTLADVRAWLGALDDQRLATVLDHFADNPTVVGARARLTSGAPAPSRHVVLRRPLVDRRSMFAHLAALRSGRKLLLVIHGEPRVGKTHTRWIVQEEIQLDPVNQFIPINLEGANNLEFVVGAMTPWFADQSQPKGFVHANSTMEAWANTVASEIFRRATNDPSHKAFWFVFDNWAKAPSKPQETIAFFMQLMELVATQPPRANAMRLVMIDHGVGVPAAARPFAIEEKVEPAERVDIESFYKSARPDWTSTQVDAALTALDAKLAAFGALERMEALALELTAVLP